MSDVQRIMMRVQYDGAAFHGWQIQTNGISVQEVVENSLGELLGMPTRVFVAGRTDAGVHALAMPVHFDTPIPIPPENLSIALQKYLPETVSVLSAQRIPLDFDVRRNAIMRWYRYQILNTSLRRPLGPRAWKVHKALDLDAMQEGIALIRGRHDFEGFRSAQCQSKRTVLEMEQATMQVAGELITLDFKCRSFLHHMIRFLTGSLIAMGRGKMTRERFLSILDEGIRPRLVHCAPPEGLCLMDVGYNEEEKQAILTANPAPPSF